MMTPPQINYRKCLGCETCVDVCNNEIFESYTCGNRVIVRVSADGFCAQCCDCQTYCEQGAISFLE